MSSVRGCSRSKTRGGMGEEDMRVVSERCRRKAPVQHREYGTSNGLVNLNRPSGESTRLSPSRPVADRIASCSFTSRTVHSPRDGQGHPLWRGCEATSQVGQCTEQVFDDFTEHVTDSNDSLIRHRDGGVKIRQCHHSGGHQHAHFVPGHDDSRDSTDPSCE